MAERCGLTMLLMFTARNCKGKWNKNMPHERCLYNSLYERFKRYGCSEPGMFSDLVCREACQCDSKQDII